MANQSGTFTGFGNNPYRNIRSNRDRCKEVDTHELLKKEIKRQGEGSIDGGSNYKLSMQPQIPADVSLNQYGNPVTNVPPVTVPKSDEIGVADHYIYFDSATAENTALSAGQLVFSVVSRHNNVPIENVIEIEVGDFYFPDIPLLITQPSFYYYGRATLAMEEIKTTQSIQGANGFRFHYEFDVANAGIVKRFTPIFPKILFAKPIRDITQLTFTFRAPTKVVPLPQEVFTITALGGAPGVFQTSVPHGWGFPATAAHSVYITDFNSVLPTNNTIVNSTDGVLIPIADILSTTTFQITGTNFAGDIGQNATMTVGDRKVAFTMRFRTLTDSITNRIVPV